MLVGRCSASSALALLVLQTAVCSAWSYRPGRISSIQSLIEEEELSLLRGETSELREHILRLNDSDIASNAVPGDVVCEIHSWCVRFLF